MEEIYIINNKEKLYNIFYGLKLYVIIEIFFNDNEIKLKPIKIQKHMYIDELPNKLSDLYLFDNNIHNIYNKMRLHNRNELSKKSFETNIIIFEESTKIKNKLSYNTVIIP
jgi:hypothetical protein